MNIPTSLALALMLGGAAAMAQGVAPPTDRAQMPAMNPLRHATGIVITVDAATGKLHLKDNAGKITRYQAKKAKVQAAEGKIVSLADLSIGDKVAVMYSVSVKGKDVTEIHRLHKALKR